MKKIKKQKNSSKGITLIALVITIIVLLILAAVSIATLTGQNGILTQASNAKVETRGATVEEIVELWKVENEIKEHNNSSEIPKSEGELLQELLDNKQVFEEEIDREKKTITIGNRVINYGIGKSLTDIYVALYNDGTLVFNNKNEFDESKIVENGNFGNIKDKHYEVMLDEQGRPNLDKAPPWFSLMMEGTNISSIDFISEIVPNNENISNIFIGLDITQIKNIENLNTSNVTSMNNMFSWCRGSSIDLSKLDLSNVTDMSNMFADSFITNVNLSGLDLSNVTDMSNMFEYSNITSVDLSKADMSSVTNMGGMFNNSNVTSIDLSNSDTHNVANMSVMFYSCGELTNINLNGIDTSNVTNMSNMFSFCRKLASINVSNFNTSKVTNMVGMFSHCTGLTSLDVSKFDISKMINNPTRVQQMFSELTIPITINSSWTSDMKNKTGYKGSEFIEK